MDKILQMRQKRAEIIKNMRALVTAAEEGQRALTEDENTKFEGMRAEAEQLATSIVREEQLRGLEGGDQPAPAPAGARSVTATGQRELENGIRTARFVKCALLAKRTREAATAIAERLYLGDEQLRAVMTEGTASDGGVLVPENLYNEIIPLLRQTGITRSLGAIEIPLPNGNLTMPKQTGAANFTWVGENKPIGNSKITMGNIKLSAKKLAGIIPISNELLADASIAADRFIRDEIVSGIAESEDITALYGTGTENAPKGITVACAANKVAVDSELTAETIYTLVGKMLSVKLTNPALAWRIPGVLWAKIYGMQTASGSFIFRDEMNKGTLCGYPFKIDNNIKVGTDANGKTQIFLGDWKHFLIGSASALQISISTDASYKDGSTVVSAFENDLTLMRAIIREDFGVRYNEAFVFADGIFTIPSASQAAESQG